MNDQIEERGLEPDFGSVVPESNHIEALGLEPYVGSDVAMKMYNCKSYSTLWLAIKDGTFPPPDKVIKRVRKWKPSTLRKWQDAA